LGLYLEEDREIFLVQVVFDLHLQKPEVRAVESFNSDLFSSAITNLALIPVVGINNTEEEKGRNNRSIKNTRNYVQNSNRENHRAAHKFTIYQSDYKGEENPHSRSVQWHSQ